MSIEVVMPQLTDTMLEGVVQFWHKNVGDFIEIDEPLVVVETDKAAVEILAETSGVILKIFAEEGQTVNVDELIVIIGKKGEKIERNLPAEKDDEKNESVNCIDEQETVVNKIVASPVVRRIAKEKNIDLSEIVGTGKDRLITKADIELYIDEKNDTAKICSSQETVIPLTGIRKAMFNSMTSSLSVPQVTTVAQADLTELLLVSKETAVTITSFVVRAVAKSITLFPLMNSVFDDEKIVLKEDYNIGVAASTPKGLAVPVIHQVQDKKLIEISEELADLAKKAKNNRLSLEDISGKTFTVTNSGVFGSLFFTPRITPPEVAILGIGKINQQPVIIDNGLHIRSMMYLCLSYDHRIIDGETAVKFLQKIKTNLESPKEM